MADAPPGTATASWHSLVKPLILLFIFILAVVGNLLYDRFAPRSIIVQAETGTVRVTLTREFSGSFENAIVCLRRQEVDLLLRGAPFGCTRRTHVLSPDIDAASTSAGSSLAQSSAGGDRFDFRLPAGSRVVLYSEPDQAGLLVEEVPDEYASTDVARLEGGGVTLSGEALSDFERLIIRGRAVFGSAAFEQQRGPTVWGSYEIRGWTPTSPIRGELGLLRTGELRPGALFFFQHRREVGRSIDVKAPLEAPAAEARVDILGRDPDTGLLRVAAASLYEPVRLTEALVLTEPTSYGATLVNALLADPILVFFATLLAGAIGVLEFFFPTIRGG